MAARLSAPSASSSPAHATSRCLASAPASYHRQDRHILLQRDDFTRQGLPLSRHTAENTAASPPLSYEPRKAFDMLLRLHIGHGRHLPNLMLTRRDKTPIPRAHAYAAAPALLAVRAASHESFDVSAPPPLYDAQYCCRSEHDIAASPKRYAFSREPALPPSATNNEGFRRARHQRAISSSPFMPVIAATRVIELRAAILKLARRFLDWALPTAFLRPG